MLKTGFIAVIGMALLIALLQPTHWLFNHQDATATGQQADSGTELNPKHVPPLMRQKLDRAKSILEGLTLENYDKIASSARQLRLLSTETGWNVVQTEQYRIYSEQFRRDCSSLEQAAKAKDVNRAALAYVGLTVHCVQCHTYMRENKIKLTDGSLPKLPDDKRALVQHEK